MLRSVVGICEHGLEVGKNAKIKNKRNGREIMMNTPWNEEERVWYVRKQADKSFTVLPTGM